MVIQYLPILELGDCCTRPGESVRNSDLERETVENSAATGRQDVMRSVYQMDEERESGC